MLHSPSSATPKSAAWDVTAAVTAAKASSGKLPDSGGVPSLAELWTAGIASSGVLPDTGAYTSARFGDGARAASSGCRAISGTPALPDLAPSGCTAPAASATSETSSAAGAGEASEAT